MSRSRPEMRNWPSTGTDPWGEIAQWLHRKARWLIVAIAAAFAVILLASFVRAPFWC